MPTLDWIGKKAVVNHHQEVPYRLLKCDRSLSVGDPGSGNLLVEGDNLVALKALLPYYAGKVKCIYIDPPYNTGEQTWIYNDAVNSPAIRKWLGKTVASRDLEDLSRHDKWLCMMYPRLRLLKDFLREDGVLFVSIDDIEVGHLRLLCDEIFGPYNFVANVIWEKKYARQNDATWFSTSHDHVLVYAKSKVLWRPNEIQKSQKQLKSYRNPDKHPLGLWQDVVYTCNKTKEERPNLYYPIPYPPEHAKFGETVWPNPNRVWAFDPAGHEKNVREGRVWWGERFEKDKPRLKSFLKQSKQGLVPATIWSREDAGDNQDAKREAAAINPEKVFPTPKPVRLLQLLLSIATGPDSLVLDSFAGSGTTAAAVMKLNESDGGSRRFVLIEMEPEVCQDLTAPRLMNASGQSPRESGAGGGGAQAPFRPSEASSPAPPSGGFRYCKLGEPLFDESGMIRDDVTFADLAAHVFFAETGEPIPKRADGKSPLIGACHGTAYYLLFNGALGDKRPDGGNVLTGAVLEALPPHDGPRVVYGEGCRLGAARLDREGIVFRQVPYEIKVR